MSERSDRIKKAIADAGLSYGEISNITGIAKSALHRYANGQTDKIPLDRMEEIAKATHVSAKWIMWGVEDDETEKEELTLSPKEQVLLKLVRKMSDSQLDNLISFLESK